MIAIPPIGIGIFFSRRYGVSKRGMRVIHITQSGETARAIVDLLTKEGFYAKISQIRGQAAAEESDYEISVADSEAIEAQQWLVERNLLY